MRWLNSRALYLASAVTLAFGLTLICGFMFAHADTKLVVGSAFLVTAGVIFTAAVKLHSEERDRAYRFLAENVNSAELLSSLGFIGRLRALNGGALDAEQATEIFTSNTPDCRNIGLKIQTACNFFEEMAIAIRSRQINEFIVREFYAGMLYRVGEFVNPLLPAIRNSPPIPGHASGDVTKPEVYENMLWLYERWGQAYEAEYLHQEHLEPSHVFNESVILIALIVALVIVAIHSFGCAAGSGCSYLLGE